LCVFFWIVRKKKGRKSEVGSILMKVKFRTHCGLQNRRRAPAKSYSTWYRRIDVPFHKVNQGLLRLGVKQ
jgi:hypothetical protein